jgi:hypothetical protein
VCLLVQVALVALDRSLDKLDKIAGRAGRTSVADHDNASQYSHIRLVDPQDQLVDYLEDRFQQWEVRQDILQALDSEQQQAWMPTRTRHPVSMRGRDE